MSTYLVVALPVLFALWRVRKSYRRRAAAQDIQLVSSVPVSEFGRVPRRFPGRPGL